jgi:inhibitor of KinA sporulation pathway (predicted exonuclease)
LQNEIIEIGLAILSPQYELIHSQGWFVKPVQNPILSDFCKTLTTITQADVDSAKTFPEVMPDVESTIQRITNSPVKDALFISWGNYDRKQFLYDCELHHYPYPFGEHMNLKKEFSKLHKLKNYGMNTALNHLKIPLEGTHHRGLDDALNIAKIFQRMRESLPLNPTRGGHIQ